MSSLSNTVTLTLFLVPILSAPPATAEPSPDRDSFNHCLLIDQHKDPEETYLEYQLTNICHMPLNCRVHVRIQQQERYYYDVSLGADEMFKLETGLGANRRYFVVRCQIAPEN